MGYLKIITQQVSKHFIHSSNIKPNNQNKKHKADAKILISAIGLPSHKIKHKHNIILEDFKENVITGLDIWHNSEESIRFIKLITINGEINIKIKEIKKQNIVTIRKIKSIIKRLLSRYGKG